MANHVDLVKYIHVLFAVTLFGLSIAQYHYLRRAKNSHNDALLSFSVRFSKTIIWTCFSLSIIPPLTGPILVGAIPSLNWSVRWVNVAMVLGISACIQIILQLVLLHLATRNLPISLHKWWSIFSASNVCLWLCLILIIRDAVSQHTWF